MAASTRFTCDYDLNTCIAYLKVENALVTDRGTYRCLGENEAGTDQTSAKAVVMDTANIDESAIVDPSRFFDLEHPDHPAAKRNADPADADLLNNGKPARFVLHLPQEIKLLEGERVQLKCKVEGYPLPKVS